MCRRRERETHRAIYTNEQIPRRINALNKCFKNMLQRSVGRRMKEL